MYYVIIFFPYIIASKTIFSSEQILSGFSSDTSSITNLNSWFLLTGLSIVFISIIFLGILYFRNGTKNTMFAGSIIKVIPLILIIFVAFFILGGLSSGNVEEVNQIFNPKSSSNIGLQIGNPIFLNLMLLLPPMMFAFDGFLFVTSLSNESKDKSKLKGTMLGGVIIIISLYFAFSIATLLLGQSGEYEIEAITGNLFPNSQWIVSIIVLMVFVSIFTSTMGSFVTGVWSTSSASSGDQIFDENGLLIRRRKNGMPYNTILMFLVLTIFWVILIRFFDGLGIVFTNFDVTSGESGRYYIGMTNFITNIGVTTNFFIYMVLIVGTLFKRRNDDYEGDKQEYFSFFAIFSIILITMIIIASSYDIFNDIFNSDDKMVGVVQLIFTITFFSIFIIGVLVNEFLLDKKNNDDDVKKYRKEVINKAYHNQVPYSDIMINHDVENVSL